MPDPKSDSKFFLYLFLYLFVYLFLFEAEPCCTVGAGLEFTTFIPGPPMPPEVSLYQSDRGKGSCLNHLNLIMRALVRNSHLDNKLTLLHFY